MTRTNQVPTLLSRDEFSARVLAANDGLCCVPGCGLAAVDPHHIVERRLWPDGGYYVENGAPLCAGHHLQAEQTTLSAQDLRDWCRITRVILPPQFEDGEVIDKWGNPILPNRTRIRGELFFEEPVQKALAAGGVLPLFTHWVKHAKTFHCPTSPGVTKGDRVLSSMDHFKGRRVIMTEKRDGECSTLYQDHMHARSLDSRHHPSRDWLKSFWSNIRTDIPKDHRVVGESLYAVHSVAYSELTTWFEGFMFWDDRNRCFPWDETLEWFSLIGSSCGLSITPVPVLYDGVYDEDAIQACWQSLLERDKAEAAASGRPVQQREGYVLRLADGFAYRDFRNSVCKWVRPNHVQTDQHWMDGPVVANGLIR